MTRAVLSLGSNLGDRLGYLCTGLERLAPWLVSASGVYETPPWGDTGQPAYLNSVVIVVDDRAAAHAWLDRARAAEQAAGRVRDPGRRFGPRTLDVDVIGVWEADGTPVTGDDPELVLPHPRAHERAFVLRPWLDVEPYARLPGHGAVTDLLRTPALAAQLADVHARADLTLESVR